MRLRAGYLLPLATRIEFYVVCSDAMIVSQLEMLLRLKHSVGRKMLLHADAACGPPGTGHKFARDVARRFVLELRTQHVCDYSIIIGNDVRDAC